MPDRPRQLALPLGHAESFAREDFLAGPSNAAALALIERWPDWPARIIGLIGPEGAGKSHLSAIWAAAAGARMVSGRSLAEASLPSALTTGALVLEDVADTVNERALFHLLNLARAEDAYVLLTARTPPSGWKLSLPDLASRLRALPVVTLVSPEASLLRAVLVKLLTDRQLAVEESLLQYLLARIERSFAGARAAVARLDAESLRQKRPANRALAAELFRERMI